MIIYLRCRNWIVASRADSLLAGDVRLPAPASARLVCAYSWAGDIYICALRSLRLRLWSRALSTSTHIICVAEIDECHRGSSRSMLFDRLGSMTHSLRRLLFFESDTSCGSAIADHIHIEYGGVAIRQKKNSRLLYKPGVLDTRLSLYPLSTRGVVCVRHATKRALICECSLSPRCDARLLQYRSFLWVALRYVSLLCLSHTCLSLMVRLSWNACVLCDCIDRRHGGMKVLDIL